MLKKQKEGKGHWKPELASDSEEAVGVPSPLRTVYSRIWITGLCDTNAGRGHRSPRIAIRLMIARTSRWRSCRRGLLNTRRRSISKDTTPKFMFEMGILIMNQLSGTVLAKIRECRLKSGILYVSYSGQNVDDSEWRYLAYVLK